MSAKNNDKIMGTTINKKRAEEAWTKICHLYRQRMEPEVPLSRDWAANGLNRLNPVSTVR